MNCSQIEEYAADYLAGHLEHTLKLELESHLGECAACRETLRASREIWTQLGALPQVQPSPELRLRVNAIIAAYRQGQAQRIEISSPPPHWWDGLWTWWSRHPAWQLTVLALVFAVGLVTGPQLSHPDRPNAAFTQLREEVGSLKELITLTLLQQPSASERLQGINWSYQVSSQDEKVLAALVQALETDPNVNVRVATVEALRQFSGQSLVRNGLLRSLAKEDAPLVQIELIDLMVRWREKASIPMLQKITQNPDSNLAVRQHAEWGLQQLIQT